MSEATATEDRVAVSSVTISRNAKGTACPEVKVYDADPREAKRLAVEIFDDLTTRYPFTNAG